ncbi:tRNA (adenosine(37)-N6)-threonylcarbamoyltransferase complex ATPase subunit type 1 TsaE [Planctomicrobium sp. SH661]|uniref:tRNA (adenosine(37)-N6)-threonylcarbamoyltransferase complex ATPase subunit type 1 TsaE n=1 Tax=Planctomicrobium sp. SH661 TaxID=3448124 RepID=UPI003F5B7AC9
MNSLIRESHSLEETFLFGRQLAAVLQAGDVVSLIGNLGAGKTHLVQAIAEGLNVDREEVHSPTFVLIQEYDGRIPVCHVDAYRLRDIDEFLELGADELLGGEGICLIEWADRVEEVLPRDRLTIRIETTGITSRRIELVSSGPRSSGIVTQLSKKPV